MSIEVTQRMIDRVDLATRHFYQCDLARQASVSTTVISCLVNGRTKRLELSTWNRIKAGLGYEFDVQFFGRKLHTGGPDENHQIKIYTLNADQAWDQVRFRYEFDIVKKISCEPIHPKKTKEELEEEKKIFLENFPSTIREYVSFFVHSESTDGLQGELKILKNMFEEMKKSIGKCEEHLLQESF